MSGHITPEENEHHPETRLEQQAEQIMRDRIVALEQVEQKYGLAIRTIASAELENLDSKATIARLTAERDEAVKRIDFMGGSSRRRAHDEPCKFCGEPINSWGGNPELWPVFMCWRDDPGKMKPHHVGCIRERIVAAEAAEARAVAAEKANYMECVASAQLCTAATLLDKAGVQKLVGGDSGGPLPVSERVTMLIDKLEAAEKRVAALEKENGVIMTWAELPEGKEKENAWSSVLAARAATDASAAGGTPNAK